MLDQRDFLAALDWVLATPDRWALVVDIASCSECSESEGVCDGHRRKFGDLNGKDEVDA